MENEKKSIDKISNKSYSEYETYTNPLSKKQEQYNTIRFLRWTKK